MKNIHTSTLSNKEFSFDILDSIQVQVQIEKNEYNLPIDGLFTMAARINKKRSFLFMSKLLGKHLPINPNKGLLTSALLAAKYYEVVKGGVCGLKNQWVSSFLLNEPFFTSSAFIPKTVNPLIIGFAETATALGHAFFDCFEGADYVHTTREVLYELQPLLTFEEEHSHATSHRCYMPVGMIDNNREIVLVDDELTTGKTALNMIRSLHSCFPRREYSVVSILDWRSEENKREFKNLETSLGITIHVVSLIAGKVQVKQQQEISEQNEINMGSYNKGLEIEVINLPALFTAVDFPSLLSSGNINDTPFLTATGRFGIDSCTNAQNQRKITEAASFLANRRCGRKTLCLGTGEFMYLPMKIAAEMGPEVFYQSTTRSPVFVQSIPEYGARYGFTFPNPEDMGVTHFVYNIPPGQYDELFIFFEREADCENLLPMLKELEKTQIMCIKLVYFIKKQG